MFTERCVWRIFLSTKDNVVFGVEDFIRTTMTRIICIEGGFPCHITSHQHPATVLTLSVNTGTSSLVVAVVQTNI